MKKNKALIAVALGLFAVLVLVPGFYQNQWRAAGRDRFIEWRRDREAMVIARIVESRKSGIFSYGGMLGFGCTESDVCKRETFTLENLKEEYVVYYKGGLFLSYDPYTSHPGVQGVVFSLLESASDSKFEENLDLFHGIVSLISALTLGLFFSWVYMEIGLLAALTSLLFVAISEWMTFYGGNIFWNLWAFYLPFVSSSLYLMRGNPDKSRLGLILYFTIIIKCLFTGFEFIATAMVMPLIPFVYYAVRDKWKITLVLARIIKASLWILSGVFTVLLILLWQISEVKPTISEAVETLTYALEKRTYGDPVNFVSEAESLSSDLLPVLMNFVTGRAIRFGDIFHLPTKTEISYLFIFKLFFVFTLILILLLYTTKKHLTEKKITVITATIITTWMSLGAPLSWFVLFKAHAYEHPHLDFIVWQMPYTLYGFALFGLIVETILYLLFRQKIFRVLPKRNDNHLGWFASKM